MLVGTFNSSESNNTPMKSIRSYTVGKEIQGEGKKKKNRIIIIINNTTNLTQL